MKGQVMCKERIAAVKRFLKDDDGATLVEYAVMLMLIILGCVTIIQTLGNSTAESFDQVQKVFSEAGN